jgi:hypothetical protein
MNDRVAAFVAETHEAFLFLETGYHYKRLEQTPDDAVDYRDARIVVRYVGERVGVEVSWYFAGAWIDVRFTELRQPWTYSEPGTARRISLRNFAELGGHQEDPDFVLKNPGVVMGKKYWKRARTIQAGTRPILEGLARATRTYAASILSGDTSMFLDVMRYETKKLREAYPGWEYPDPE